MMTLTQNKILTICQRNSNKTPTIQIWLDVSIGERIQICEREGAVPFWGSIRF